MAPDLPKILIVHAHFFDRWQLFSWWLSKCLLKQVRVPMADDFPEGDGYDDLSEPEFPLPDGVTKEILIEAATSQWLKPKVGDEVTIHFVAKQSDTSSQESDFIEFDSSKVNGEPMSFTPGKEEVVKGLELGIPTMRKGELAKFKMTPEFGYGPAGTSKVPGGATLIYEVELISWKVRTDLFTDGSVIKTTMEEGTGWKTPHLKEEVCLSITIACAGSIQRELTDFEYTLGSDKLWGCIRSGGSLPGWDEKAGSGIAKLQERTGLR